MATDPFLAPSKYTHLLCAGAQHFGQATVMASAIETLRAGL
jgi:hypothetical protein